MGIAEGRRSPAPGVRGRSSPPISTCSFDGCPSGAEQTYRAVATRLPEGRASLLGPFQVWGSRRDDPNDIVPHEHRRDLRGLSVFEAWVNNSQRARRRHAGHPHDSRRRRENSPLSRRLHEVARQRRRGRSEALMGGQRAVVSQPGHHRPQHRGHGHRDAGLDEGEVPGPSRGRLRSRPTRSTRRNGPRTIRSRRLRTVCPTTRSGRPGRSWRSPTRRFVPSSRRVNTARRPRIGSPRPSSNGGTGSAGRSLRACYRSTASASSANALEFDDLNVTYGFAPPRDYTVEWHGFDNAKDVFLDRLGTGPALPRACRRRRRILRCGAHLMRAMRPCRSTCSSGSALTASTSSDWIARGPARSSRCRRHPCARTVSVFTDLSPQQRALFETYVTGYNASQGQPVHARRRLRPAHDLRADDVLRRDARAHEYTADRCAGRVARNSARSHRVD